MFDFIIEGDNILYCLQYKEWIDKVVVWHKVMCHFLNHANNANWVYTGASISHRTTYEHVGSVIAAISITYAASAVMPIPTVMAVISLT